jgi:hypothetical protein
LILSEQLDLAEQPRLRIYLVEQRLGVFKISGVETLGEPAVDLGDCLFASLRSPHLASIPRVSSLRALSANAHKRMYAAALCPIFAGDYS